MPRGTKMARLDANHSAVIDALRKCGYSVRSLASVGSGMPDVLVGYRGVNVLLEVKDGKKRPSERKLTEQEGSFFRSWRGQVVMVDSVIEALDAVEHAVNCVKGPLN